jgi:hypothetical protein
MMSRVPAVERHLVFCNRAGSTTSLTYQWGRTATAGAADYDGDGVADPPVPVRDGMWPSASTTGFACRSRSSGA